MKAGLCHVALLFCATLAAAEDLKTVAVPNEGTAVMTIGVPRSAAVITKKDETIIDAKDMRLDLWVVPNVKTVDDAVATLSEVIKGEVLKFSVSSTESITVAETEAKHLIGKGLEADDQDPATVDVVVFRVGKAVLVGCVHGEGDAAVQERQPMLKALKTIKAR